MKAVQYDAKLTSFPDTKQAFSVELISVAMETLVTRRRGSNRAILRDSGAMKFRVKGRGRARLRKLSGSVPFQIAMIPKNGRDRVQVVMPFMGYITRVTLCSRYDELAIQPLTKFQAKRKHPAPEIYVGF